MVFAVLILEKVRTCPALILTMKIIVANLMSFMDIAEKEKKKEVTSSLR
jgi:hypothetical protein